MLNDSGQLWISIQVQKMRNLLATPIRLQYPFFFFADLRPGITKLHKKKKKEHQTIWKSAKHENYKVNFTLAGE